MLHRSSASTPDIYVHVPKTAGMSLRKAIVDHHGSQSVYVYSPAVDRLVRADREIAGTRSRSGAEIRGALEHMPDFAVASIVAAGLKVRKLSGTPENKVFANAAAIVGHFAVDRFASVETTELPRMRTVVRDPLARIASHYNNAQSSPRVTEHYGNWATGQDASLDFKHFALSEPVRNFQTQYTGDDIGRFDLVGTTERFNDFLLTAGLVSYAAEVPHVNKGRTTRLSEDAAADPGFMREFSEFHSADYAFYEAAVERQLTHSGV